MTDKRSLEPDSQSGAAEHCVPLRYPDRYTELSLATELGIRLIGRSADGTPLPSSTERPTQKVVWVDAGDEVLVHLDSINIKIIDGMLLVSIDLECDQTGRTALIVPLALGSGEVAAGMVATTEEFPRGNGLLASRWGAAVQAAVWGALLGLLNDFATERDLAAISFSATSGALSLTADEPLHLV
jgi:hypothetical protein